MTTDLGVRVVYRSKDMKPVYTRTYPLREFTEMIRADLMRLVTDVEDLCYAANGNKEKEDWSDETFAGFNKIKHKLLDKAGDISRMPDQLVSMESEPLTDFVARMINEGS